MGFKYDPAKTVSNLKKHKVRLSDSEGVFADPLAIHIEDPGAIDEQRFLAVGMGSAGLALVVCYTYSGDEIRPISARRASRNERRNYESGIQFL